MSETLEIEKVEAISRDEDRFWLEIRNESPGGRIDDSGS